MWIYTPTWFGVGPVRELSQYSKRGRRQITLHRLWKWRARGRWIWRTRIKRGRRGRSPLIGLTMFSVSRLFPIKHIYSSRCAFAIHDDVVFRPSPAFKISGSATDEVPNRSCTVKLYALRSDETTSQKALFCKPMQKLDDKIHLHCSRSHRHILTYNVLQTHWVVFSYNFCSSVSFFLAFLYCIVLLSDGEIKGVIKSIKHHEITTHCDAVFSTRQQQNRTKQVEMENLYIQKPLRLKTHLFPISFR